MACIELRLVLATVGVAACAGGHLAGSPAPTDDAGIAVYTMQSTSFGPVFRASLPHRGYPVVIGRAENGRTWLVSDGGRRPRLLQAGIQDLWADGLSEPGPASAPSLFALSTTDPQCSTQLADGRCLAGANPLGPMGGAFVILLFDQPVDRALVDSVLAAGASVGTTLGEVALVLRRSLGATASGSWP